MNLYLEPLMDHDHLSVDDEENSPAFDHAYVPWPLSFLMYLLMCLSIRFF